MPSRPDTELDERYEELAALIRAARPHPSEELRVRVRDADELSSATSSAMRLTRRLGGFVVRADYDTPGDGEGDSLLVVRVPVARVQDAIAGFAELGPIVGQRIAIEDLQAG